MGLFGPPNVKYRQARGDVRGLIKALGYQKDKDVRIDAARALITMRDPRSVKPLVALLGDEDSEAGRSARIVLEGLGAPVVHDGLKGASEDVRTAAAKALAYMVGLQPGIRQAAMKRDPSLTPESFDVEIANRDACCKRFKDGRCVDQARDAGACNWYPELWETCNVVIETKKFSGTW